MSPEFCPPLGNDYGDGQIDAHCEKANEAKPQIECGGEKYNSNDDINDAGNNVEEDVTGNEKRERPSIWGVFPLTTGISIVLMKRVVSVNTYS